MNTMFRNLLDGQPSGSIRRQNITRQNLIDTVHYALNRYETAISGMLRGDQPGVEPIEYALQALTCAQRACEVAELLFGKDSGTNTDRLVKERIAEMEKSARGKPNPDPNK